MITLELPRLAAAAGVVAAYAALCLRVRTSFRKRHGTAAAAGSGTVLVAYGSQSGLGRELAEEAVRALGAAGVGARLAALGELSAADLQTCGKALFVASTTGEGDPPDNAAAFVDRIMGGRPQLGALRYGLLALGDRSYARYCAFGRALDGWLRDCGAAALFERVEVDRADPAALETWRHRLASFAGLAEPNGAVAPVMGYWRVRASRHLNPGSAGQPVHHVELEAVAGPEADAASVALPRWEAGDLLQLVPPGADARPRDYSIASLPEDGAVHLLVRVIRGPDGEPGRMSSLLTGAGASGNVFQGRIRAHPNFRLGDNAARPLILVGNGTGLAGLLALLRQRARRGDGRNWLVFGERNAAHDGFHADELAALERADLLARCDRVFSRDGSSPEYVQHRLARAADTLREWVAGGAAIYVCGNAVGMGPAVHDTLAGILGAGRLAQLAAAGRYRRDIY
ncbi:NADPH cytochrome P450 oxidoreductase family protein [Pseudothauera rhizosphaerae]|uniref:NADPH--hemoprotein reductase n=1 Tax=Pseudothauera rhizosphaerae TaxID=2565932 RepID=A0A4S4ADN6_9RHOO|nr:NADPH cytochrome P450 oxidoreductase family protein [Pseudothauera rhizosphaerae]THF56867.1 oxidoreductase [Pseudothauera rhizosphaerae]